MKSGHIGSIRRQISSRAAHRQEFAKARLRILEAVAESSQAEAECSRGIRNHLAILPDPKRQPFSKSGSPIRSQISGFPGAHSITSNDPAGDEKRRTSVLCIGGGRDRSRLGQQDGRKPAEIQHLLHPLGRAGDNETTADALQLGVKLHQQTDAGGAEKRNLGQIQTNAVRSSADYFLQVTAQMLGPIVVEAPLHLDFECVTELLGDDFHGSWLRTHASARTPEEW